MPDSQIIPLTPTLKTPSSRLSPNDFIDTDLCVMCGMCTPHCPTYNIYQTEAESPRGRISIIQALANNKLKADDKALAHLNHCLGCRACETICPSKVPFMDLMDKARQLTVAQHKKPAIINRLLDATLRAGGLRPHQNILSFINKSGLPRLLSLIPGNTPTTNSINLLAHSQTQTFKDYYAANNKAQGSVLLFTGCMGSSFNSDTIQSGIKLLTHFGFNVHIPMDQHCCGALHQHNGQMDNALALARKNKDIFQRYNVDAILHIDSGCGSQLARQEGSIPFYNISQFILEHVKPRSSSFNACTQTVLLHESCSLRNSLKLPGLTLNLMNLIPELCIQAISHPASCCGAGGSNFLEYPELAGKLLHQKLSHIEFSQGQLLISDNIGCSLHIKSGLKDKKIKLDVIHPVTLLARQLK